MKWKNGLAHLLETWLATTYTERARDTRIINIASWMIVAIFLIGKQLQTIHVCSPTLFAFFLCVCFKAQQKQEEEEEEICDAHTE